MSSASGYGFDADLAGFLETSSEQVLGRLADHAAGRRWGATEHQQISAWTTSFDWLATAAANLIAREPATASWHLCLEYEIPRRGGRIDAVLLADDLIFVIEFKTTQADAASQRQAEDYALELLDFHEQSEGRALLPVLCSGSASLHEEALDAPWGVACVSTCAPESLSDLLFAQWTRNHDSGRARIDPEAWLAAAYQPTPTILEAATALYAGHTVGDLTRSEASAENLQKTFDAVARAVEESRSGKKIIAFVTGTPGAGKTLAGLNLVHNLPAGNQAAFLSGNGPLVNVLQQVLGNDLAARRSCSKKEGLRVAKTLVSNVHGWIREYIDRSPDRHPLENVVIFDEAQRAWTREQSRKKFGRDASEPEMMLSAMSRRDDAVLVGLIGGGQEINTGEAGLSEWGRALAGRYQDWSIVVAPELVSGHPVAGTALFATDEDVPRDRLRLDEALHLAVSQRSYRARTLTQWVEAVLGNEPQRASHLMEHLSKYPIVMTRDLEQAKAWLRRQARGLRRCGLLASSGARRLRPHGISVRERIKETDWFLCPPEDVRSSNFLELAISEFGIQGLEVDWACLAWGGDLSRDGETWKIRAFKGTRWQHARSADARAYAINRYRVLLTRAREGLVIWIPVGSTSDHTRAPATYESVAKYLTQCGVRTIGS